MPLYTDFAHFTNPLEFYFNILQVSFANIHKMEELAARSLELVMISNVDRILLTTL